MIAQESLLGRPRHGQVARQWPGAELRRRFVDAASLVSSRRARSDRNQVRLRHRRGGLKAAASLGGLRRAARLARIGGALAADAPKYGADAMPHGTVNDPRVCVSIASVGTVSILCHRSEMGQGVRTSVPMIVA